MPLRNLVWLLAVPGLVGLGLVVGAAPCPGQGLSTRPPGRGGARGGGCQLRPRTQRRRAAEARRGHDQRRAAQARPAFGLPEVSDRKQFETESEGSYTGIGILLGRIRSQDQAAERRIPDARRTGVRSRACWPNDQIARIGEDRPPGMTVEEARKRHPGRAGSKITLTIRRGGHNPLEFPLEVTRGRIPSHTGQRRLAPRPTIRTSGTGSWTRPTRSHSCGFETITSTTRLQRTDREGGRGGAQGDRGGRRPRPRHRPAATIPAASLTQADRGLGPVAHRGEHRHHQGPPRRREALQGQEQGTMFLPAEQSR